MKADGWYRDPFGVHQERWFSRDIATDLVRDDGVVTEDIPPAPTWDRPERLSQPVTSRPPGRAHAGSVHDPTWSYSNLRRPRPSRFQLVLAWTLFAAMTAVLIVEMVVGSR